MINRLSFLLCITVFLSLCAGCATRPGSDKAAKLLLEEIRASQPEPYGTPDDSTSNYWWAENLMAYLAAERCGYMSHDEAIARIKGVLDLVEPLERHHGFSYDGYDMKTGKKTTDKIYFQGWWLYSLIVLKNAYPELAPQCERMLTEIDYENSGVFNPETRQIAADYYPETDDVKSWIDLYWQPTGEFRTPYVAYSYLTGDISPWTRYCTPRLIELEGHETLGVWHNFFFCSMLVHTMYPDMGYLGHSWDEMLAGLNKYSDRNGMVFYPTRAEPLEAWMEVETNKWPNTEHRIAKSWQAWYRDKDAPVMEKCWIPGEGVSLYCDNMNFYWSYGGKTQQYEYVIGRAPAPGRNNAALELEFFAFPPDEELNSSNPAALISVSTLASRDPDVKSSAAPLELLLNGELIATIDPSEVGNEATIVTKELPRLHLNLVTNVLTITSPDSAWRLYRRENDLWKATYTYETDDGEIIREDVKTPYAEIIIDGHLRGKENPFAFLTRCNVVHGYYVWHELLDDPQFLDTMVVWVGDYYDRASLGRVVHNVSDTPVTVKYERPAKWTDINSITVTDITDDAQRVEVAISEQDTDILWDAAPRHTYRVSYQR